MFLHIRQHYFTYYSFLVVFKIVENLLCILKEFNKGKSSQFKLFSTALRFDQEKRNFLYAVNLTSKRHFSI